MRLPRGRGFLLAFVSLHVSGCLPMMVPGMGTRSEPTPPPPTPAVGMRVEVQGATELVGPRHTRGGAGTRGEIVSRRGDTLTVRDLESDAHRTFLAGDRTRIVPRLPTRAGDRVLVGDAFRLRGVRADVVRIDGAAIHFRSANGDTIIDHDRLWMPQAGAERLVHRPFRPAALLLGATAGVIGGVTLWRAGDRATQEHLEGGGAAGLLTVQAVGMPYVIGSIALAGLGFAVGWAFAAPRDVWRSIAGAKRPELLLEAPPSGGIATGLRFPVGWGDW